MSDLLLSLASYPPLWYWAGGSILAYVLITNLLFWIEPRGVLPPFYVRALFQAARFGYYLLVPYLALGGWPRRPQQGLLALEDLGLVGLSLEWPVTRWLEAAGTGLGLGFVAFLILALAWANASRLSMDRRSADLLPFALRPWWAVLVNGLYLEVHWAFYRGALAVILDDVYAGVFVGLGAAYLEWLLNPFWRAAAASRARHRFRAGQIWLGVGLALTSALVFLLTRNLWICLAVHWLLALAFWLLTRPRGRAVARG